jgi:hypothetical protein
MTEVALEQLLDAADLRRILKCSLPYVYKLAERGQIPCVRVPCPGRGGEIRRTVVRFRPSDVGAFIQKHLQE